MKKVYVILVVLIIAVLGFFTKHMWMPPVMSLIQTITGSSDHVNIPDTNDMDTWEWVNSDVSVQGTQFSYPSPVPTEYVQPQEWPPQVTMTSEDFSCTESDTVKKRTINGNEYCVTASGEGAAGSVYTTYDYKTKQGDFLVQVNFVLRTPQCANYDEPNKSNCEAEQANFNVDVLTDRIASSITMQ